MRCGYDCHSHTFSPCRWEVQAANRAAELGIDGTDAIPGSRGGSGRAGEPGRLVGRRKYG